MVVFGSAGVFKLNIVQVMSNHQDSNSHSNYLVTVMVWKKDKGKRYVLPTYVGYFCYENMYRTNI